MKKTRFKFTDVYQLWLTENGLKPSTLFYMDNKADLKYYQNLNKKSQLGKRFAMLSYITKKLKSSFFLYTTNYGLRDVLFEVYTNKKSSSLVKETLTGLACGIPSCCVKNYVDIVHNKHIKNRTESIYDKYKTQLKGKKDLFELELCGKKIESKLKFIPCFPSCKMAIQLYRRYKKYYPVYLKSEGVKGLKKKR